MHRLAITILMLPLLAACGCSRHPRRASSAESVTDLFGTHDAVQRDHDNTWKTVTAPRQFQFPADHAAHDDYRIEWWYYTGNLHAEDGRRFGYQLTFFRTGIRQEPANPSRWAVRDLYTAHFGISDIQQQEHFCFQRNSRGAIDQAGAQADHYEVWNGDWSALLSGEDHLLTAADSGIKIKLTLTPSKPLVLHGDQGLSQKGPTSGNASYYYSFTRLFTLGTIQIHGETFHVQGHSWMDHEFSTSFLEPGQVGWDWLSIQLNNDVELMLYRMRREDGSTDPFSSGSIVQQDGKFLHLGISDFNMSPGGPWESKVTGAVYPLRWKVEIPSGGYLLDIRPAFEQQEMDTRETTGISYWEGAIEIKGDAAAGEVEGTGYMELTGYAGQGLGSLLE